MNQVKPNSQYNLAAPEGLAARTAERQRLLMYDRFVAECRVGAGDTILDVGATSDRTYSSSNYLELWYPTKDAITAAGIDDGAFLAELHPGMRFVRASGLDLPFADRSFDVVHSSAVIEHVGSRDHQARLVAECARVARRAVFLTTPNRWFPIEVHTALPLLHWLPDPAFRKALNALGLPFFAEEKNLNLLSRSDFLDLGRPIGGFAFRVLGVRLAGWISNLLLVGERTEV